MTDTNSGAGAPAGDPKADGAEQSGTFRVMTQYIKDLSFENPNAPGSLASGLPQPAIDILVDVLPKQLGKEQFEVTLQMTAKATRGENVVFIVELMYAGIFNISGIPENSLQPLLMIEGPRFLFPFARRVISDVTRDGGFPPLALDYMDFTTIYRQQLAKQGNAAVEGEPAGTA